MRLGEGAERFAVLRGEPFARLDLTLRDVTRSRFEGTLRLRHLLLALREIGEVTLDLRLRGIDLRLTIALSD